MKRYIIRRHGRYSVELKFRYFIHRQVKKRRNYFNIKFYLFFPYSFNINSTSYPKDHFYEDQKLYLRFNTPVFTLEELRSEENSPFVKSSTILEQALQEGHEPDMQDYVYETKLCGSVYKSVLRDSYNSIRKRLRREEPENRGAEIESMMADMAGPVKQFHELTKTSAKFSEDFHYHTLLIDEYISLELERHLLWLLDLVHSRVHSGEETAHLLEKLIYQEMEYRKACGYTSVSGTSESQRDYEEYVYRAKILKRYASEVLFFNVRRKYQGKRVEHILYAIAAGIAMFFATAIAFLGQTTFGNLSTSLFILLIASYMLKDRLKDVFRDLFSKSIGAHFYDRGVKVYDPRHKQKMAYIKERVAFSDINKLPLQIRKMRSRGSFERFLATTASESVLVYEKNIRLNATSIRKLHSRIKGVADINIISVRRLLRYLTVQSREVPLVSEGYVKKIIPVKRIYHLNLVVWYQGDDTSFIERVRLVVDGKGIKRIEKVDTADPPSAPK
ncbi:MAG: hypothetical protein U5P10_12415 [Spirochaetia bacterium]|nr:hypothetical protein [Spirochaetia bacterium]